MFCPQLDLTLILFCFCHSDVWWVLYSKAWFCADTSISCYCRISSWVYCSAHNVPSSSCLQSYLFFSFLPTRFALMPLSAVLPRGRQKVKQEKAVFPYGISALSCRAFCARRSSVELGVVMALLHHWWRGLLWVCTHHTVGYCWSRGVTSFDCSKVAVTIRVSESLITCNDSTGRLKQKIQWTTKSLERVLLLPSGSLYLPW